jgi:hypothetical protein
MKSPSWIKIDIDLEVGSLTPITAVGDRLRAWREVNLSGRILHPANPGSVYHLTKTLDQLMFAFYAKNDGLRITDLHQGIVWGTQTDQTALDERLINRFDYDGDYGTVLNRFLMQAAIGHPLTVHGTGGQTRAFIHIKDTVRCVEIAISHPPKPGDRPMVLNQVTETHRVIDLAKLVADTAGGEIAFLPNPRVEAEENDLAVRNDHLLTLGLRSRKDCSPRSRGSPPDTRTAPTRARLSPGRYGGPACPAASELTTSVDKKRSKWANRHKRPELPLSGGGKAFSHASRRRSWPELARPIESRSCLSPTTSIAASASRPTRKVTRDGGNLFMLMRRITHPR